MLANGGKPIPEERLLPMILAAILLSHRALLVRMDKQSICTLGGPSRRRHPDWLGRRARPPTRHVLHHRRLPHVRQFSSCRQYFCPQFVRSWISNVRNRNVS